MRFPEFYRDRKPAVSFELFPPKTDDGLASLKRRIPRMIELEPTFMTVTYGAMGSTQERTLEIVNLIREGYSMETAHHLTCVGHDRSQISDYLDLLQGRGIENIVALRGDPPQGAKEFRPSRDGFSYAWQLVELIRKRWNFGIAVAGYPEKHIEAPDFDTDLRNLRRKVDCGADVVITQLFYRNAAFYRFVDKCRSLGVQQPIVPGLLPILSTRQIERIAGLCGCVLPAELLKELQEAGDDEREVARIGVRYTVEQALDLLNNGVPGIHFYVLNRYFHIAEIMEGIRARL